MNEWMNEGFFTVAAKREEMNQSNKNWLKWKFEASKKVWASRDPREERQFPGLRAVPVCKKTKKKKKKSEKETLSRSSFAPDFLVCMRRWAIVTNIIKLVKNRSKML